MSNYYWNEKAYWEKCRLADIRAEKRRRELAALPPAPKQVPQSLLDATKWLMVYHPERLQPFVWKWSGEYPGLMEAARKNMRRPDASPDH